MIININFELWKLLHSSRHATKQSLNNFEHQKPWKYEQYKQFKVEALKAEVWS